MNYITTVNLCNFKSILSTDIKTLLLMTNTKFKFYLKLFDLRHFT